MATRAHAHGNRADFSSNRPRAKKPWWYKLERAILYPTVLVALIGVSPQWYDRAEQFYLGLPVSKKDADKLQQLWQRNYICAAAPGTWLSASGNVRILSNVCDTGDVFVHATTADGRDHYGWLSRDDIMKSVAAAGGGVISGAKATPSGGGLIGVAKAEPLPAGVAVVTGAQGVARAVTVQPPAKVICQRVQGRYAIRRVQTPTGCVDKLVDTFTGTVVSTKTGVPCTAGC
jgi:hypothetical protein